jgi:hypothetical protein
MDCIPRSSIPTNRGRFGMQHELGEGCRMHC